jgi:hypothetical protein
MKACSEVKEEGHKFACGVNAIRDKPIVYSIGAEGQEFELGFLKLRPDAEIYMFELKVFF